MYASSGAASRVFSGRITAPSVPAANIVSANAGWLGPRYATRSPGRTPRSRSPCARRWTRSRSSRYVSVRPSAMKATRSGVIRARRTGQEPTPWLRMRVLPELEQPGGVLLEDQWPDVGFDVELVEVGQPPVRCDHREIGSEQHFAL